MKATDDKVRRVFCPGCASPDNDAFIATDGPMKGEWIHYIGRGEDIYCNKHLKPEAA